ncbi:MAG: capsule assembly Wzi family protein, partial [Rhodospirillales bacterium]|nr:capsule assembly Wzi family protein [Rhodospirillales bacterium]
MSLPWTNTKIGPDSANQAEARLSNKSIVHISNRHFFPTSIRHRFFASLAIFLSFVTCAANAGPWIEVGDSQLRSDIQILADAGVIRGPVSTWPLAWGDIANQLDASVSLEPFEMAALTRVRKESRRQIAIDRLHLDGRISVASNPIEIRGFENTPREEGEIGISASWTGENTAFNLQVTNVDDPVDDRDWRGDGSYAGFSIGNWMYSISAQDRWWGPGWQGSLIMSNNARPIPALVLDRNSTHPFKTKWLSWLGPWDLYVMWGQLESSRDVPDANFFGARLTFKPIPSL